MKLQIRNKVFETNSSSIHSITVSKSDCLESLIPKHSTIYFSSEYAYGWEWETYTEIEDKASYLWLSILLKMNYDSNVHNKNGEQTIINTLNIYIEKIKAYLSEYDIEAEFDIPETRYDNRYYDKYYAYFIPDGYIDHAEDLYGFADKILESKEMFLNYLFNPVSIIQTGNDNDDRELDNISVPNELLSWRKEN